jgi:hypothetical protein
MKNVHLIPTDKPQVGCLVKYKDGVVGLIKGLTHNSHFKVHIPLEGISIENNDTVSTFNIYITSDLEIKDSWVLNTHNEIYFLKGFYGIQPITKKIILTTDEELQKDGVQAIDDEFLEWFVKNPSCEFVDISTYHIKGDISGNLYYKIIIPQEEPDQDSVFNQSEVGKEYKQEVFELGEETEETLEEVINKHTQYLANTPYKDAIKEAMREGANYQAERMYSEEEAIQLLIKFNQEIREVDDVRGWFEQFKKI